MFRSLGRGWRARRLTTKSGSMHEAMLHLRPVVPVAPGRPRETRIGEVFQYAPEMQLKGSELAARVGRLSASALPVLFLASDAGCVANLGQRAAERGAAITQQTLFTMQHHSPSATYFDPNVHTDGRQLLLLEADLADIQERSHALDKDDPAENMKLCAMVEELGARARPIIRAMLRSDRPALVVGAGDNYGYDCIKEIHQRTQKPVVVINFDPHADCRDPHGAMEQLDSPCPPDIIGSGGQQFQRHSGNWVTQAVAEGLVHAYVPVGLDPLRNNAWIFDFLHTQGSPWKPFRKSELIAAPDTVLQRLLDTLAQYPSDLPLYLNFDADSVKGVSVSALNPDGLQMGDAYACVRGLLQAYNHRVKVVRLAELGADPATPLLSRGSGVFGANFIVQCLQAQQQ